MRYFPCPPVSVCGTGGTQLTRLEAFLGGWARTTTSIPSSQPPRCPLERIWAPDLPKPPAYRAQPTLSIRSARLPSASPHRSTGAGAGISNLLSIAYACYGLGLGPTNPGTTAVAQEPLGFRCAGFSPPFTLLIPAFALRFAPRCASRSALLSYSRTLPYHSLAMTGTSAASVLCLSPVTLSAQRHSTSELLRTLSRMAASKPTSWLSTRSHILSH